MQNTCSTAICSFNELVRLALIAPTYEALRRANPDIPARTIKAFIDEPGDCTSIEQFMCRHEFAYTGTQYGGDDERWHGEGRAYCQKCGMDGDA